MNKKLIKKIRQALKEYNRGSPLKDYLDDDEIIEALIMFTNYHNDKEKTV